MNIFFRKKFSKCLQVQKKVVPLHRFRKGKHNKLTW